MFESKNVLKLRNMHVPLKSNYQLFVFIESLRTASNSSVIICSFKTQIIDPDPGLNYNLAISTGDPAVRIVC